MTSDEMQSAIEFLLRNQANFDLQLEKTIQQLAQTNEQLARTNQQLELTNQRVSMLADTQTEFIQTMLQHVEAQGEINASMRRTMKELAQSQQQTQTEISDLTKIVGGLVNVVYKNGNPLRE
jgi:ABC-type Fe2+-enterobactin transport system substrate-binding protein